jgi:putative ATPase
LGIKFKILNQNIPLAEKLRPKTLEEVLGQEHLTGKNGTIRKMIENDTLKSLIFWGPPGTGKTTLAEIISENSGRKFFKLSAVSSGVKEVREVIDDAKKQNLFSGKSPILFIDEIHRFNKSQQDSLLHAVEKGWNREIHNFKLSFLFSFKDKKKRFHDSKSICHLQIHRTDIKRGINHNNSAK